MTGCRARQIILPENLKVIETWAFAGSCITELVIPKSVKRMDYLCLFQSQVQKLTILGKPKITSLAGISEPPEGAEFTADRLDFEEYPRPYRPIHGLRSFARRWLAEEDVPVAAANRFHLYLEQHYQEHWTEPLVMRLAIEMQEIPAEEIDSALALESGDPAITAAHLAYQNDMRRKKVRERVCQEDRQQ